MNAKNESISRSLEYCTPWISLSPPQSSDAYIIIHIQNEDLSLIPTSSVSYSNPRYFLCQSICHFTRSNDRRKRYASRGQQACYQLNRERAKQREQLIPVTSLSKRRIFPRTLFFICLSLFPCAHILFPLFVCLFALIRFNSSLFPVSDLHSDPASLYARRLGEVFRLQWKCESVFHPFF